MARAKDNNLKKKLLKPEDIPSLEELRVRLGKPVEYGNNTVEIGDNRNMYAHYFKKNSPIHIIHTKRGALIRNRKDSAAHRKLYDKLLSKRELDLDDILLLSREGVNVNRNLKEFAEEEGHVIGDDNRCMNCNMELYDAAQTTCPSPKIKREPRNNKKLKKPTPPFNYRSARVGNEIVPLTYSLMTQPYYINSQRRFRGEIPLTPEEYAKLQNEYNEAQYAEYLQYLNEQFKGDNNGNNEYNENYGNNENYDNNEKEGGRRYKREAQRKTHRKRKAQRKTHKRR
jgi:hypothetical protein